MNPTVVITVIQIMNLNIL